MSKKSEAKRRQLRAGHAPQEKYDFPHAHSFARYISSFVNDKIAHKLANEPEECEPIVSEFWRILGAAFWNEDRELSLPAVEIDDEIKRFYPDAFLVPIEGDSQSGACETNVEEMIRQYGGEKVIGYQLLHTKGILVEACWHTIWKKPDGTLVDPTEITVGNPAAVAFVLDPDAKNHAAKWNWLVPESKLTIAYEQAVGRAEAILKKKARAMLSQFLSNQYWLAEWAGKVVLTILWLEKNPQHLEKIRKD